MTAKRIRRLLLPMTGPVPARTVRGYVAVLRAAATRGAQQPAPPRVRPQEAGRPRRAVAAQDVDRFQQAEFERELIRERTVAGLKAARARGRRGGSKFALTKAQVRLAQAAMAHRDTSVSALCRQLGIRPWRGGGRPRRGSIHGLPSCQTTGGRADLGGRNPQVARGGLQTPMPEQEWNRAQVGAGFKEMDRERVPKRVRENRLGEKHASGGDLARIPDCVHCDRRLRSGAWKEPVPGPGNLPPVPQDCQQLRREHHVAVLLPLTVRDAQHPSVRLSMADTVRRTASETRRPAA